MKAIYDNFLASWGGAVTNLSPASRHTVEILKKKLEKSPNPTNFYLGYNQIVDVSPLSGLTTLSELNLQANKIVDVKPLSGLTNLSCLDLSLNQIADVNPLSSLTNLSCLDLLGNQICDLSPLSGLTTLTNLNLLRTQICDLTPLSGLTNLTELYLHGNQIWDLTSLSGLTNLTSLGIAENQIVDLTPLRPLTKLKNLNLSGNRLSDLNCLLTLSDLDIRWNNVRLPRKYWIPVEQWSAQWILKEANAQLRRILIRQIGYQKILKNLSAKKLDSWREYTLLKIDISFRDEENIYLLEMTCPSTGHIHFLRVPPQVNSAIEAIRWVNWGINSEDFAIET